MTAHLRRRWPLLRRRFNFEAFALIKVLKHYQPRREVIATPREKRESRHARGYDAEWTRIAASHMRASPVCIECERKGLASLAAVVDHKIPVRERPELRLVKWNRWSLCHFCHQGIKKRMEAYAKKAGMIDLLAEWCDDPSARPAALQRASRRRGKEEMIV